MAFFGYPEAHDNDGERAAHAGLTILNAISELNEHPTHPKLAARVGIDSGAVAVGAGPGKEAISAPLSKSPAGKVRDQRSCAPRRASRTLARENTVAAMRRARSSPRSTTGSPRASTPPT
jgi:hypothetical protein